jgi:hypothetical protein
MTFGNKLMQLVERHVHQARSISAYGVMILLLFSYSFAPPLAVVKLI